MSKKIHGPSRFVVLSLIISVLIITLVLAPEVGAASEISKTETEETNTINTDAEDDALNLNRAITIDEAKKEAQESVLEQLAAIAAMEEAEETEAQVEETEPETPAEETSGTQTESDASSSTSSSGSESSGTSYVAAAGSGYLMGIDNPDYSYVGYSIALTDYDRDLAERIIMGEAGSMGYTGMALVAQCIRDTYVLGNYSSIADVIYSNGYYGSTSITPSAACKEVVSYIFDQGGSAVQHRILTFYASNYCSSAWHETQNYVCSCGYVRFFDSWT